MSQMEFNLNDDNEEVFDETDKDETVVPHKYDITSYGADYDVEGFVKRLNRGDVFIPGFQRDYVWTLSDASRFVESLLLGLPVPGVFLAKEKDSNKLLVIDGQQRLKTLQFFFGGVFNPKKEEKKQRIFKLLNVQKQFEGRSYDELEESDRIKLNDSIIHATIIKQEVPEGDDTSVYYVFERLNSGGRKLTAQEIRSALYHGELIDLANELNSNQQWREIFGKVHTRLKDIELIIRFLALLKRGNSYEKPMGEFLNKFTAKYRLGPSNELEFFKEIFNKTIYVIYHSIGRSAFKIERGVNAAVFDSIMVGVATRLIDKPQEDMTNIIANYNNLLKNKEYQNAISKATSDELSVLNRIKYSIDEFSKTK